MLTDRQAEHVGEQLVLICNLKRDTEHPDRFKTEWGTKTLLGLGRVAERLVTDAHSLP